MQNKFLRIEDVTDKFPNKKTKTFWVYSLHNDIYLGVILWHPQWRRYIMQFESGCLCSVKYMAECYKFIAELMQKRKQNGK